MEKKSVSITVNGTVQGVGFRPFVVRIAKQLGINGSVCNTSEGVLIKAYGSETALQMLYHSLQYQTPPLARIESFSVIETPDLIAENEFQVVQSVQSQNPTARIAPDTTVCKECLSEIRSSENRRYRHAFVNCTECGPRYSIVEKIPYDRQHTSMKVFPMCSRCEDEFHSIADRRFHAQPVCCPDCGPRLQMLDKDRNAVACDDPISKAREILDSGGVLAVKGIGGFHFACRVDNHVAVGKLRSYKSRVNKPFACMIRNIDVAKEIAHVSDYAKSVMSSKERPIVLVSMKEHCKKRFDIIAPSLSEIGLMLPYTPIHHLLFDNAPFDMLVMTSANPEFEPMYIDEAELFNDNGNCFDAVLTHNRSIVVRLDDSVVRAGTRGLSMIRRGRGYVPGYFSTPFSVDGIIGLGAQMKNSISIGKGSECFVSEYMGSTDSTAVVQECCKSIDRLLNIMKIEPHMLVTDLHPDGLLDRLLDKNLPVSKVQHHHAHAAACMGEHGLDEKTICVVYDGTGAGDDGTIWGSEIFIADYNGYERVAHLDYMPLVGNDAAIRNPGRIALAACVERYQGGAETIVPWMNVTESIALRSLIKKPLYTTLSSGMGRLFDACSAILDVCRVRTYEGQPAMELEAIVDELCNDCYEVPFNKKGEMFLMDSTGIMLSVVKDRELGVSKSIIAAKFHNTISKMTIDIVSEISKLSGIKKIVLSGGCFSNQIILNRVVEGLLNAGLTPYCHKSLPPGDECVSFGQVLIAASRVNAKNIASLPNPLTMHGEREFT